MYWKNRQQNDPRKLNIGLLSSDIVLQNFMALRKTIFQTLAHELIPTMLVALSSSSVYYMEAPSIEGSRRGTAIEIGGGLA